MVCVSLYVQYTVSPTTNEFHSDMATWIGFSLNGNNKKHDDICLSDRGKDGGRRIKVLGF